jgi:ADP-heptose:LPS heptosyltransferase
MWGGLWSRLLGCQNLRSRLLTHPRHMADIWLDLARALHLPDRGLEPNLFLSPTETQTMKETLRQHVGSDSAIIVHPGCAGNTCNLPFPVYLELIQKILSSSSASVVLTGSLKEGELYRSHLKEVSSPRFWNSCGSLSLRDLCALIASSQVVVSVGTGPLHLASALRIPTVNPFCHKTGVSSQVWGNLGSPAIVLHPPEAVCQRHPQPQCHCTFEGTITSESLYQAVQKLISAAA